MSKLYIANPTPQTHTFAYVVPDGAGGRSAPRIQVVPVGGQVELSGDLTGGQIDAIIDQHHPYGLFRAEDVTRQQDAFVSLICSVDKPVSATVLRSVMEKNTHLKHLKGRQMRKEAAIAVSNRIEDDMQEQGMPGNLTNLDMEIVEERTARSDGAEMVPQRVRVTKEVGEGSPPRSRGRGRGRKAA